MHASLNPLGHTNKSKQQSCIRVKRQQQKSRMQPKVALAFLGLVAIGMTLRRGSHRGHGGYREDNEWNNRQPRRASCRGGAGCPLPRPGDDECSMGLCKFT